MLKNKIYLQFTFKSNARYLNILLCRKRLICFYVATLNEMFQR